MRATVLHGPSDVRPEDLPEPQIHRPTDALVRVEASCVCGSDLWRYRGVSTVTEPVRMGHEFVGVVEEVGDEVSAVAPGNFLEARGDDGVAELRDLLGGPGADVVIEAVGTRGAMEQAVAAARPGGNVGYVGVPAGITALPVRQMFGNNLDLLGGVAPVRAYVEELLPEVLAGTLDPSPVFDLTLPLDGVARAYAAMDSREAVKAMLRG